MKQHNTYKVDNNIYMTVNEISKEYDINPYTLRARIARGIVEGQLLVATARRGGHDRAKVYGEFSLTIKKLAEMAGCPLTTMRARLSRGLKTHQEMMTGKSNRVLARAKKYKITSKDGLVEYLNISEISKLLNTKKATIRARLAKDQNYNMRYAAA